MTARTTGQAAFEAYQRRRYRHPAFRTDWDHPAVDACRPAWEDAGQAAVETGAGPALAAAHAAARQARELLGGVHAILADPKLRPDAARRQALETIQQAEQEGERQ